MLAACISIHMVAPILGALFNIVFRKFKKISFVVNAFALGLLVVASLLTTIIVFDIKEYSYVFGGWTAPFGIEFKMTFWNGIFLLLISFVAFASFFYGYARLCNDIHNERIPFFNALFLICVFGLYGVVMTNDLFNLYVFIELSSIPTYTLISWNAQDKKASMAAFNYLIVGSVASVLFLIGVGYLYSVTGTLNITHMLAKLKTIDNTKIIYLGSCLMAFGLLTKSAIFPMHSWVLKVYEHTNPIILPFLGGTSNKIYFYAFIKLFLLGFFSFDFIRYFLLASGIIILVWFSVAVLFEKNLRIIFALSGLIQVGYVAIMLFIGGENSMLIITSILVSHSLSSVALLMLFAKIHDSALSPYHLILFIVNALGFVGFPATVGFIPKLWLLQTLIDQQRFALLCLIVITFFFTFAYLFRVVQAFIYAKAVQGTYSMEDLVILILTIFNSGLGLFALNFLRLL